MVQLEAGQALPATSALSKEGLCGAGVQGPGRGEAASAGRGPPQGLTLGPRFLPCSCPRGQGWRAPRESGLGSRGEKGHPGSVTALGLNSPPVHTGGTGSLGVLKRACGGQVPSSASKGSPTLDRLGTFLNLGPLGPCLPSWAPTSLGREPGTLVTTGF